MGLDNIPMKYPCKSQGTAVLDGDQRIDCDQTKNAGGCPWQNDPERPQEGAVYGMLGTSCWYRGKYGEYILEILGVQDATFYGDNEDGTEKSPESCRRTSEAIEAALEKATKRSISAALVAAGDSGADETVAQIRHSAEYAAWWLRWAGREAGGSSCWY